MTRNYIDAQLGAILSTDPVVTLFNYLKTNWTQATGYAPPDVTKIKFDSKFGLKTGFYNYVIVERMPTKEVDLTLGRVYKRIYDNMRMQIFCQSKSAINDRWNTEMHIRSIIDANPIALRSSGIDEVSISAFEPIITDYQGDTDITKRVPATAGMWISRSKASVQLIYDLVAQ